MIKALKIATGEEIICELTRIDEMYKVTNPAQLIVIPGDGKETFNRLSLMPYAMYLQEGGSIMLNPDKVVWEGVPNDKMLEYYSSNFGSGIKLYGSDELDKISKLMESAAK
jgi:hypothetical protein